MLLSSISILGVLLMLQHNACVCVRAGTPAHANYVFIHKVSSHIDPVVLELIQGLLKLGDIKGWERSARAEELGELNNYFALIPS